VPWLGSESSDVEFSDAVKSLRLHWRLSLAIMLAAVVALGAFLLTRNTVRAPNRYKVSEDLLIPAIDSKGVRPQGVPPSLLQGQQQMALSSTTEKAALADAHLSAKNGVKFDFGINNSHDIATLSATAHDKKTAQKAVSGYLTAFGQARQRLVANAATGAQQQAAFAIVALENSLSKTQAAITRADPALLATLPRQPVAKGKDPTADLPPTTPSNVQTLVVQRNELLSQIQKQRETSATNNISSVIPSGYTTPLQTYAPVQVTPPPPPPYVPIAAFLGVGLLLAIAVPILRDRLDRSIRTPKAAAAALGATVLTSVPPVPRRYQHVLAPPGSAPELAYRALAATSIATDRLPEAIVVTSPTGKTQDVVAANFAAALAGLGMRVALVATEPRQSWFVNGQAVDDSPPDSENSVPEAHDGAASEDTLPASDLNVHALEDHEPTVVMDRPSANVPQAPSFGELLELAHEGRLNGSLSRGLVESHVQNLFVVGPGQPNGKAELDGLRPLLEALSSDVHVTVIAGPALLEDPDATIFAWTTRSVLWAIETGEVTEVEAKEAASRLSLAGVEAFGIAMVNVKSKGA